MKKNKASIRRASLKQAVILAGGFGTRMSSLFPKIPKPMVPIGNIPILEEIILECKKYNFRKIILILHHGSEEIINYFSDGNHLDVEITYFIEKTPLGTGGSLKKIYKSLAPKFLLLYADVYSKVNLNTLFSYHKSKKSDLTLVVHPNSHPHDSDLVVLESSDKVTKIIKHPHTENTNLRNIVNAAMYVCNKSIFNKLKFSKEKFDIAQDLVPYLLKQGFNIFGYNTIEYIKDMGTPERYKSLLEDIKRGICDARSLEQEKRAIFIDRDGTINHDHGHINSPEKVNLIKNSAKAIKIINSSQYLAICITNQPVIARGECSFSSLDNIHGRLDFLLGKNNAYLNKIYFCPHHPDKGFKGEVSSLKIRCNCRKPEIGLFIKARNEFNLSLNNSWMIGDRTSDVMSAKKFQGLSALVQTGDEGKDNQFRCRPSINVKSLYEAILFINSEFERFENFSNTVISKLASNKFIFITGNSRSGKTTLASILQNRLLKIGLKVHIVELDQFLLKNRSEDTSFDDRFNNKDISNLIEKFNSCKSFYYTDYGFNHITNERINFGRKKVISTDIVIFEGTVAFKFCQDAANKSLKVFVQSKSNIRLNRFKAKYSKRGLSTKQINDLWDLRESEEVKYINKFLKKADLIFNNFS